MVWGARCRVRWGIVHGVAVGVVSRDRGIDLWRRDDVLRRCWLSMLERTSLDTTGRGCTDRTECRLPAIFGGVPFATPGVFAAAFELADSDWGGYRACRDG